MSRSHPVLWRRPPFGGAPALCQCEKGAPPTGGRIMRSKTPKPGSDGSLHIEGESYASMASHPRRGCAHTALSRARPSFETILPRLPVHNRSEHTTVHGTPSSQAERPQPSCIPCARIIQGALSMEDLVRLCVSGDLTSSCLNNLACSQRTILVLHGRANPIATTFSSIRCY